MDTGSRGICHVITGDQVCLSREAHFHIENHMAMNMFVADWDLFLIFKMWCSFLTIAATVLGIYDVSIVCIDCRAILFVIYHFSQYQ